MVEREVEANVAKLRAAAAHKRHLFVWMNEDATELEMFAQSPPDSAPSLPDGVDVVWAATRGNCALFERLWRLCPPDGWEAIRAE